MCALLSLCTCSSTEPFDPHAALISPAMEDLKTTTPTGGDAETESGDVIRVGTQHSLHNDEKYGHVQKN
jgi:hypothetical protein